jgi:hypothetical protein
MKKSFQPSALSFQQAENGTTVRLIAEGLDLSQFDRSSATSFIPFASGRKIPVIF